MAEVLTQFADPVRTSAGGEFFAQVCAAPNDEGLWEGWIEFVPSDGGVPLRSPRETTQPNRTDAVYWAGGLTGVYLEGALDRALNPVVRKVVASSHSVFDKAAPPMKTRVEVPPIVADAVLDPFSVYEKGETLLRQQLGALSAWHLVNIIVAYQLSEEPPAMLNKMPNDALIELIVTRVRKHSMVR